MAPEAPDQTYCEACEQAGKRTPIPADRVLCADCIKAEEATYHGPQYAAPTPAPQPKTPDTPCPNCGYLMSPLDDGCKRCVTLARQGKGLAAQRVAQPALAPKPAQALPIAPAPTDTQKTHLRVCAHCEAEISEDATTCPLCGHKIPPEPAVLGGALLGAIICGVCGAFVGTLFCPIIGTLFCGISAAVTGGMIGGAIGKLTVR